MCLMSQCRIQKEQKKKKKKGIPGDVLPQPAYCWLRNFSPPPWGVPSSLGWWVQACDGNPLSPAHFPASASRAPISWWSFGHPGGCTWHLLTWLQYSHCLSFLPPSPLLPSPLCLRLASWGIPFFIPWDPIASSTFHSAWSPQQLWQCILFIFFNFYILIRGLCVHCMRVLWMCVCGVTFMCVEECTHLYTSEVQRRTLDVLLYLVLPCPGEVVPAPLHLGGGGFLYPTLPGRGISTPPYIEGGISALLYLEVGCLSLNLELLLASCPHVWALGWVKENKLWNTT